FHWACSLTEGVEGVGGRKIYDFMQRHTIKHAILAHFEYGSNEEGQKQREQACTIAVFQSSESDYRVLTQLVESLADNRYLDSGATVFECETDDEKETRKALANLEKFDARFRKKKKLPRPLLICAPRPGLLLTSYSGKACLHPILERLADPKAARVALSANLP